jgi:RNA polymerase sigma factor (sigma-70 family)
MIAELEEKTTQETTQAIESVFDKMSYLDLKKIDDFIDEFLISDFLKFKIKIDKNTGERLYIPYVRVSDIVNLGFSPKEIVHIIEYLGTKDIRVRGKVSALDGEFKNYEYTPTYKTVHLPEPYSKCEQIVRFRELASTKDIDKRTEIINDLVIHNMRFANYVSKKFVINSNFPRSFGLEEDDIKQLGYEGLIKAVNNYDVNLGYDFTTYAYSIIAGTIKTTIANSSSLSLVYYWKFVKFIKIVEEENCTTLEENPSLAQDVILLMQQAGVITKNDKMAKHYIKGMLIDRTMFYEDVKDRYKVVIDPLLQCSDLDPANDSTMESYSREELLDLISTLGPREQEVIKLRYGFTTGKATRLVDAGTYFNLSGERVRQIEVKALKKIREKIN